MTYDTVQNESTYFSCLICDICDIIFPILDLWIIQYQDILLSELASEAIV